MLITFSRHWTYIILIYVVMLHCAVFDILQVCRIVSVMLWLLHICITLYDVWSHLSPCSVHLSAVVSVLSVFVSDHLSELSHLFTETLWSLAAQSRPATAVHAGWYWGRVAAAAAGWLNLQFLPQFQPSCAVLPAPPDHTWTAPSLPESWTSADNISRSAHLFLLLTKTPAVKPGWVMRSG